MTAIKNLILNPEQFYYNFKSYLNVEVYLSNTSCSFLRFVQKTTSVGYVRNKYKFQIISNVNFKCYVQYRRIPHIVAPIVKIDEIHIEKIVRNFKLNDYLYNTTLNDSMFVIEL